ncbi:MAG TPA: BatA domain-containing protein [Bacteroidota bacterium]|nr:BatA domain-containing protein [Bacteroidota bacterium]
MTFLNPLVLLGLAAAAIPVLLHLLNLRKLRTVEFSSVRFLKDLQKSSMRRIRIRQILLLVIRTLLIVAIVSAFARPTLRGSFGASAATAAASTMIVIVDDSPSMAVRDDRGTAFARAQQTAAQILTLATERDKLYLTALSELRPGIAPPSPRTMEGARGALERMAVSSVSVRIPEALRSVRPLLASSTDANREVIIITDGQATQLRQEMPPRDSTGSFVAGARLFFMSSPPLRRDNAGILHGEVMTRIISDKKPLRVRGQIENFGEQPLHGMLATLSCDGARVAQRSLDIAAGSSAVPEFTFTARRRGLLGCSLQTEDDALDADNTWYFVVDVPESISLLLTGPNGEATRLASIALNLGGDSLLAGAIHLQTTTNTQLASADLPSFDVIVLCGYGDVTEPAADRLARYTKEGGGLLLFGGAESGRGQSQTLLLGKLGIPSPGAGVATEASGNFLSFGKIDFAHPIFDGMFETPAGKVYREPEIESPRVKQYLPLRSGAIGTTIIALSNGDAFLADYPTGTGRVLACAVEAGTTWSDFPVKGIFAPLLHRAVAYLRARSSAAPTLHPGDPLRFSTRLRHTTERDTYTITGPDGFSERVAPASIDPTGMASFAGEAAMTPGVYLLARDAQGPRAAPTDLQAIAVNVDPAESDLRSADEADLEKFRLACGILPEQLRTVGPGEAPAETIQRARFGLELWQYFLVLAVILALAEMALAWPRSQGAQEAHAT